METFQSYNNDKTTTNTDTKLLQTQLLLVDVLFWNPFDGTIDYLRWISINWGK